LKKEFFSSIIAIFDLHDYYDFHVYFIDEISFLRYEILDSILITSALTMQQNGYYAPTIVYSKSSWFYSTFLTNFNQLKDFASGNLNFSNKDFSYERILSLAKECNVNSSLEEFRKIFVEYCKKAK